MASATIPLHTNSGSILWEVSYWTTDRLAEEAERHVVETERHVVETVDGQGGRS